MTAHGLDSARDVMWTVTRVFVTPALNPKLALALYATVAVFLLLLLVVGLLIALGPIRDEAVVEAADDHEEPLSVAPSVRRASAGTRIVYAVGCAFVILGIWVVTGVTTSSTTVCKSCHWPTAQHAKVAARSNPHMGVACVSCHESGGEAGRYLTDVPRRALHIAANSRAKGSDDGYGQVTGRACENCHMASLSGTKTNRQRGLRISHSEPLAAAATCIDCHRLQGGIVGVHNAGMSPCLRCHDDRKASSKCETCHRGGVSAAVRARTSVVRKQQIRDVSCGGCHDEEKDCDPCHGMRMPHTRDFMSHQHARAAAVDLWYNEGKSCGHCHTAYRNPCSACHSELMGSGHGSWMAQGHKTAATSACNTCHQKYAFTAQRDFCKDVCHSKAAREASPR